MPAVRVVPVYEFAAVEEPSAIAVLGDDDGAEITAGSTVLFYGDGGATKTTLSLDGGFHLASGVSWLSFPVPRPVTVLVIENEGPRGPFRQKLARKLAAWERPLVGGLFVLEEPWADLRLDRDDDLGALREMVEEYGIDVLMLGPAASSGFTGAGTPDDIEAHARRLVLLRQGLTKPLTVWLVHHENKTGGVSGAWERLPDTLVHVRLGDGGGCTLLTWKKCRWSSRMHGRKMTLRWSDGEGFELVDQDAQTARRAAEVDEAAAWLREYVTANPGAAKSDVERAYAESHGRGARARVRQAIENALQPSPADNSPNRRTEDENPGPNGEYFQLRLGPGKSPAGQYLYAASGADSHSPPTPNGESASNPPPPLNASTRQLAAAYREGGEDGESASSDQALPEDAEIERLAAVYEATIAGSTFSLEEGSRTSGTAVGGAR